MPLLLLLFAGVMLPLVMVCRALLEASIWLLESRPVKTLAGLFSNPPSPPAKPHLTLIKGNLAVVPERSRLN